MRALGASLDTTPLFPTTATSARAIVAGESVMVSPSTTVTTATSPTKGDIIQIIALNTVTGATPVTVAIGGSKVVNGNCLVSATSFFLGAPGASATIQYDGTNWRMIAGQQDTGWVLASSSSGPNATPYNTNWSDDVSFKVGWRAQGNILYVRGWAVWSGGGTVSPGSPSIFTIPAAFAPGASNASANGFQTEPAYTGSGSSFATCFVTSAGKVENQITLASGGITAVGNQFYYID